MRAFLLTLEKASRLPSSPFAVSRCIWETPQLAVAVLDQAIARNTPLSFPTSILPEKDTTQVSFPLSTTEHGSLSPLDVLVLDRFWDRSLATMTHNEAAERSLQIHSFLTDQEKDVFEAAGRGDPDLLSRALSTGDSLTTTLHPVHGASPLHLAAAADSPECIEVLLDAGCPVDIRARNSSTPLHWAAQWPKAAKKLLENGANPTLKTMTWLVHPSGGGSGQTPLHWAVLGEADPVVELLVEYASEAYLIPDERGVTPLDLAASKGSQQMQSLMNDLGDQHWLLVKVEKE